MSFVVLNEQDTAFTRARIASLGVCSGAGRASCLFGLLSEERRRSHRVPGGRGERLSSRHSKALSATGESSVPEVGVRGQLTRYRRVCQTIRFRPGLPLARVRRPSPRATCSRFKPRASPHRSPVAARRPKRESEANHHAPSDPAMIWPNSSAEAPGGRSKGVCEPSIGERRPTPPTSAIQMFRSGPATSPCGKLLLSGSGNSVVVCPSSLIRPTEVWYQATYQMLPSGPAEMSPWFRPDGELGDGSVGRDLRDVAGSAQVADAGRFGEPQIAVDGERAIARAAVTVAVLAGCGVVSARRDVGATTTPAGGQLRRLACVRAPLAAAIPFPANDSSVGTQIAGHSRQVHSKAWDIRVVDPATGDVLAEEPIRNSYGDSISTDPSFQFLCVSQRARGALSASLVVPTISCNVVGSGGKYWFRRGPRVPQQRFWQHPRPARSRFSRMTSAWNFARPPIERG